MAEIAKRIEYFYTVVPHRAGEGLKIVNALKAEGINLIAYCGFPTGWQKAQLDFVPVDPVTFLAAAKKVGIKLVGPKSAFLIQGEDRAGSVAEVLGKLGQAQINVTAMQAVASGEGRYGAILWVKRGDIGKTAQALGVS